MDHDPAARLRIALIAPPFLPVPPTRYGGTERIVGALADGLVERGHDVTVFAAGDSTVRGKLVPIVPESLWRAGFDETLDALMARIVDQVMTYPEPFDVIHSHLEWHGFPLARISKIPVVATLHGRLDEGPASEVIADYPDIPLISISQKQRSFWPNHNWLATIHHGLSFEGVPYGSGSGGYLVFVGRLTPEKGLDAAVEVARRSGLKLLVAAKAVEPLELATRRDVLDPAERAGIATYLGELRPGERDQLLAEAMATLMLGDWPEPFGLVCIESLATGTPVIARRAGALPEIIRDGLDGFIVDTVEEAVGVLPGVPTLDRHRIAIDTRLRFSARRMVEEYERVFLDVVGATRPTTLPLGGQDTTTQPLSIGVAEARARP